MPIYKGTHRREVRTRLSWTLLGQKLLKRKQRFEGAGNSLIRGEKGWGSEMLVLEDSQERSCCGMPWAIPGPAVARCYSRVQEALFPDLPSTSLYILYSVYRCLQFSVSQFDVHNMRPLGPLSNQKQELGSRLSLYPEPCTAATLLLLYLSCERYLQCNKKGIKRPSTNEQDWKRTGTTSTKRSQFCLPRLLALTPSIDTWMLTSFLNSHAKQSLEISASFGNSQWIVGYS